MKWNFVLFQCIVSLCIFLIKYLAGVGDDLEGSKLVLAGQAGLVLEGF